MKVVLDTNSILVSLPLRSKYRLIFDAFLKGNYDLLLSNEIAEEYAEIIGLKNGGETSDTLMELLFSRKNVLLTEIYFKWNLIEADKDDNKFSDCVIAGDADYLVSDDAHFRVLHKIPFPKIKLVTTAEFLEIITKEFY